MVKWHSGDNPKTQETCCSASHGIASIWFGEANRIKTRALNVAVEMLPHLRN